MSKSASPPEALVPLIDPVVTDLGLDLEAVELTGQGPHRVLLVAVDADGGVGIDAIAAATRAINSVLDDDPVADAVLGKAPYTLEVSSRGAHRPLTLPRHWRRNVGRLVAVVGTDSERFEARIISADDEGVELRDKTGTFSIAYAEIETAKIQVELGALK